MTPQMEEPADDQGHSRPLVHSHCHRGVVTVTLDSPSNRNALSKELVRQLGDHVTEADRAEDVRAIVITGTGSTFCAGADLKERQGASPPSGGPVVDVIKTMLASDKPIIAAVNGHARAGGLGIIAACDAAFSTSEATFAISETRLGLAPAMISTLLVRRMTIRSLSRYSLSGEVFQAPDAVKAGLLTAYADPGEFDRLVNGFLDSLRKCSPSALGKTKRMLSTLADRELQSALDNSLVASDELFKSADAQEGISAFFDNRAPSWTI